MTAWGFILLMLIAFAVIWVIFARRPGPRARIGPDGTNVREPETFVVHHEGKGQGIDISNTALKERTEEFRRGATPGTNNHRDVELAADLHPVITPGTGKHSWDALHEEARLPDATLCEEGIVAMVRNPRSLYAYWGETDPREGGQNTYHCLKVSDLTTGKSYLIPVREDDDHWFINEGIEPGHQYVVSHGWQIPSGEFNERAASAPVETPPGTPSPASLKGAHVGHHAHGSPWR